MTFQTFPTAFTDGDTLPLLVGTLPFDLTGHTLKLRVKRPTTVIEKTATINSTSSSSSTFTFSWATGDIITGDRQLCEITLTTPGGLILTAPLFSIDVKARF